MSCSTIKPIKALQALHDTPCAYFCSRFDQIHQLFHKILWINIILKSIKGYNSVKKFGKIMFISHNMDHNYQSINKIHSLFLKIEILISLKGHNSVEKFRTIRCASHNTAYTNFHQFVLKILNGNKILTSVKGHNSVENICISPYLHLSILMHLQNFIKIYQLVQKILSINKIATSMKGHNSEQSFKSTSCQYQCIYQIR